jgi:MFS family permease
MTVATAGGGFRPRENWFRGLWGRQLVTYPGTWARTWYLAVTVVATVTLYYELYVGGSVSTLYLQKLHMSFTFFVTALAFSNLIGAFGSLIGGLADRAGRAWLAIAGLFVAGLFVAFVIPSSTDKWEFIVFTWMLGIVEGICLVVTSALVRDFSPQAGRATAMGFWTSGPVVGSLIVAAVASHTIGAAAPPSYWTHEYRICGIAGLFVAVIAFFGLRELSPRLRDQLMVSVRDRALVEARAKGLDIETSLRRPWQQLLKLDVVVSALSVALFLLAYYTAVGFGVIYFTTVFGFSLHDANGLGNWNWGFNALGVVLIGVLSDRVRVRKPFMVVGGVAAAVIIVVYLSLAGHRPSYYHMAFILAALSFALGMAFTPWMASFTETVEARNPALIATGLAIWAWTLRVVVFAAYLVLPHVVDTVTPLVDYGATVRAEEASLIQAASLHKEIGIVQAHPALFARLEAHPRELGRREQAAVAAGGPAELSKIRADQPVLTKLLAAATAPGNAALYGRDARGKPLNALAFAALHAKSVEKASAGTAAQWRDWYWACFGGITFFLAGVPLLKGRWSPAAAKRDEEAHEESVRTEMDRLLARPSPPISPP